MKSLKYASFNWLHNDNHMITRCDRARNRSYICISVSKFFCKIFMTVCVKPKKTNKNLMPNFYVQYLLSYNVQLTIKLLNLN